MRRRISISNIAVLVGIAIAFVGTPEATSDPNDVPATDAGNENGFAPFELTPAGHGEISFEELTPEEKEAVQAEAEQVETYGLNSVDELAELSRQTAVRARAHASAMSLGLEGFEGEGVVP